MKKLLAAIAVMVSMLAFGGCAVHMSDVKSDMAQNQGVVKVFDCDIKTAHDVAKTVLKENKRIDAVEDDGDVLYAGSTMSLIGVHFRAIDATHTQITARSRRKGPININTDISETDFFQAFEQRLNALKSSGK